MKINLKLISLFSAIIIIVTLTLGFLAFNAVEASVIDSEIHDMQKLVHDKTAQISTLHSRASEDIVFAAKNPKFSEYFDLSSTKSGNRYTEDGVILFSEEQKKVRKDLSDWIYHFQNKFTVDETCYIDKTGQQQGALVLKAEVPDAFLSSTKNTAPFFEPSFATDPGDSYVQYPYVSPATKRWVFAYTTPIITSSDGQKSGFYHFEMPIYVFQDVIKSDEGRMFVVDSEGFLFADSGFEFPNNPGSGSKGMKPEEYFPPTTSISDSEDFSSIVNQMNSLKEGDSGWASYKKDGEKYFIVYEKLPTFYWTLAYEIPRSQLLAGQNSLDSLQQTLIAITGVMVAGGIAATFVTSSKITRPIKLLADSCKKQDAHHLEKVKVVTNDEISDVANSLNNLIEQVNQVGKMKEQFASMVTHELKTPLVPILGYTKMLQEPDVMGTLTEEQLEAVQEIDENAKRLQRLIGDVLDAQKLEMSTMSFNKAEFDAKEIINKVVNDLKFMASEKSIELSLDITTKETKIFGDKNRIRQVIENLVRNSVDFVPPKTGKITVGLENKDKVLKFSVKDNGIGIPEDKQKFLFKKFYQVDTTHARKHGGSGLGLAICKGVVEGHGGKIWVESKEGKGSVFYFTIPEDII